MAFPPPGFYPNLAMASLMSQMGQGQYPVPMGGLMPMPPGMMGQMPPLQPPPVSGITVPTGVASVSAAPVRKINDGSSLLGPYPGGLLMPPMQPPPLNPNIEIKKPTGPSITVFVGSITDRASDMLIRQLLSKCGVVNKWNRVQGANGKLQAFGFCDFGDPESAMRAIRILHEYEIADKKLVVKADDKTKEKLNEYVRGKNPQASIDDPIDDGTKKTDDEVRTQIIALLKEHEIELNRDPDPNKDRARRLNVTKDGTKTENLEDIEMEEEKRSLINREIDKFRDTYKEEPEKLPEKPPEKQQSSNHRNNDRNDRRPSSPDRDRNRKRDNRDVSNRDKDRQNRDRDRNNRDNRDSRMDDRNDDRSKPLDDDEIERRKIERQLEQKELSYQKRLREWEFREDRKARDADKRHMDETDRKEEEENEARRLKMFFEDYDDDKDDMRYYRGSELRVRLRDREKEREEDERDRRAEKRELEELRRKLKEEGHPDPESEAAKRMDNSSDGSQKDKVNAKIRELMLEARNKSGGKKIGADEDSLDGLSDSEVRKEIHVKSFRLQNAPSTNSPSPKEKVKRRHELLEKIFNNDDEPSSKMKKLPPLVDDEDSNTSSYSNPKTGGGHGSSEVNNSRSSYMSSEEKKRQIKEIIEEIPTNRDQLFEYDLDWTMVDQTLMEKRIRPWINKKITEYIGEEEPALLEFICTKLSCRSSAESILNEVAMVLDEEAEVFVIKMWRLLVYEIKAKKLGISK